jgi:hypothetical protein
MEIGVGLCLEMGSQSKRNSLFQYHGVCCVLDERETQIFSAMMLDNFEVSCENHILKARVLLLPKTTHNLGMCSSTKCHTYIPDISTGQRVAQMRDFGLHYGFLSTYKERCLSSGWLTCFPRLSSHSRPGDQSVSSTVNPSCTNLGSNQAKRSKKPSLFIFLCWSRFYQLQSRKFLR